MQFVQHFSIAPQTIC